MVISRAMRKHGVGSFTFEVLETFQTEEDALWWEGWYIEYLGSHLRGVGYNLDSGGHGGKKLSLATRQKLSKLHQGKKLSHETRAKLSTAKLGKPQTLEHIEKAAATRRGKKRSPGTIAKLRAANIGKKLSVEHRAKLSESHKNSEANIVQIAKLATANRGKKRSPEALFKMRVAQQARRTKERVGGQVIPSEQDREYLRSLAALAAYDQGLNPGVASEQQQELRLDAMDCAIDDVGEALHVKSATRI